MMWIEKQLKLHKETAKKLDEVMLASFQFIHDKQENVTEYDVQQLIIRLFTEKKLKSDFDDPIVAFGQNTSFVHYFPEKESSQKLEAESPIMIDIWARSQKVRAPFADITWIGYYGNNIHSAYLETYNAVIEAREAAIAYIEQSLKSLVMPTGKAIDDAVREVFKKSNLHDKFLHTTGHALGFLSCHGKMGGNIGQKNLIPLHQNIGYTIEPGLYHEGEFGVRSELNFYINEKYELIITTEKQAELVKIGKQHSPLFLD